MNEEDLKERANNFPEEDEMQPLVLSETYTELFENRKPAKERRPMPSISSMVMQRQQEAEQARVNSSITPTLSSVMAPTAATMMEA